MNVIYKPCPYCGSEILSKPILEKQQREYSILCPYCLRHRSEWVESIEKAIVSWNTYMRESSAGVLNYPEIFSELCETILLEEMEDTGWETESLTKISPKKYTIKSCWSQIQLNFFDKEKRHLRLRRKPDDCSSNGISLPVATELTGK